MKLSERVDNSKEDKTMKEFTTTDLIRYLQSQMDDFKEEEARYGIEDRGVQHKLDAMIACKEMVEALIEEPVNLQINGIVTVGF